MGILTPINSNLTEGSATTSVNLRKIRSDELVDVRYHLEVQGLLLAAFTDLVGGDLEIAVIEHDLVFPTGDSTTLFIPGPTSFAPIKLGRGLGNSAELYNWFAAASAGDIVRARRNGSIILRRHRKKSEITDKALATVDPKLTGLARSRAIQKLMWEYTDIIRWDFENAWLSKIGGFSYKQYVDAKVAKLSVTMVAESITRVDVI